LAYWINDSGNVLHLALSLLKNGAELNRQDEDNQTPLHLAIRRNRFKLVVIFLDHGADTNVENNDRATPLQMLSESWIEDEGYVIGYALLLLKHGAEVDTRNKNYETPLHMAIRRNRFELAGILLEYGADANAENFNRKTPLFILSESRNFDDSHFVYHARLLLEHGVAVNRKDEVKKTSLLLGRGNGCTNLCKSLLNNVGAITEENRTWNQRATIFRSNLGPSQIATLLLNYGADPNSVKNGREIPSLYQEIEGEYYLRGDSVNITQRLTMY
jgi:ankyrin repeat protein